MLPFCFNAVVQTCVDSDEICTSLHTCSKYNTQNGCKSEATNFSIYCITWNILADDFIDIIDSVITHLHIAI